MSTDIKEALRAKPYPSSIKDHRVFKNYKQVAKIFPEIGLPNCEKEIELDNSREARVSANQLLSSVKDTLDKRLRTVSKYGERISEGTKRRKKLENCKTLLKSVRENLSANCIQTNNGRLSFNIPDDISDVDKNVVFKKGERIFGIYNKLNETLRAGHFLAMKNLDENPAFKEFSTKNVPALKYKIVFSSDGADGLWDIATMSMRGISSCQTWGSGNSTHVVGSMVDPFTGIIYLTSGEKYGEYGSKMMRRCIVRFVVSKARKEPALMLERMYPDMSKPILDQFIAFLKERTNDRFNIVYSADRYSAHNVSYYVPMSSIIKSLPDTDQPYKDSGILYEVDQKDRDSLKETANNKLLAFYETFATKVMATARAMQIGGIPEGSKKGFRSLKGTSYPDYSYDIYLNLIEEVEYHFHPKKDSQPSLEDMKNVLWAMLGDYLECDIVKVLTAASKKYIKMDATVFEQIAQLAAPKIRKALGKDLEKIEKQLDANKGGKANVPIYTKFLN